MVLDPLVPAKKLNCTECKDYMLRLTANLEAHQDQLSKLELLCERFSVAIPGDDAVGHKLYHELIIQKEQDRASLRKAVIEKSLAALVWSGLVVIGSAIWQYLQTNIGWHK